MSKTALAVLGLTMEGPKHGYEMLQIIRERGIHHWINFSTASVYNTLNRLEKNHYVSETKEKIGNAPERKVYQINPKGEQHLKRLIGQFIEKKSFAGHYFLLAVSFIQYLEPEKAEKSLRKRRKMLEEHRRFLLENHVNFPQSNVMGYSQVIQYAVEYFDLEIRVIKTLIENLKIKIHE